MSVIRLWSFRFWPCLVQFNFFKTKVYGLTFLSEEQLIKKRTLWANKQPVKVTWQKGLTCARCVSGAVGGFGLDYLPTAASSASDSSWHQAGSTGSSWTNQDSPMEESSSTVLLDSLKVTPGPQVQTPEKKWFVFIVWLADVFSLVRPLLDLASR